MNNVLHQVLKELLSIVNHVSSDNYNFSCLEIAHPGTNPGVLSALSISPWYPDVWHLTEAVASNVLLKILDRSIISVQIIFTAIFILKVLQRVCTCTANAHGYGKKPLKNFFSLLCSKWQHICVYDINQNSEYHEEKTEESNSECMYQLVFC